MELMQRPSVINAPSGGAPEKALGWDLSSTKGCGGGIRFSWCSWMFGGTWIYIGGRSTSVEQQRAHEGGGRAQGGGHAPLPHGFLFDSLTCTPSLPDCFLSKITFPKVSFCLDSV